MDRYQRPPQPTAKAEEVRASRRRTHQEREFNDLWRTVPVRDEAAPAASRQGFPAEPQENILYFVEKFSPGFESWQRELVRIVRKLAQYLSPRLMRQMHLFAIADHTDENTLVVDSIHDDRGYRRVRQILSGQYAVESRVPDVQVVRYERDGDRSLHLRHWAPRGRPLSDAVDQVVRHLHRLWGFAVRLETWTDAGHVVQDVVCPA